MFTTNSIVQVAALSWTLLMSFSSLFLYLLLFLFLPAPNYYLSVDIAAIVVVAATVVCRKQVDKIMSSNHFAPQTAAPPRRISPPSSTSTLGLSKFDWTVKLFSSNFVALPKSLPLHDFAIYCQSFVWFRAFSDLCLNFSKEIIEWTVDLLVGDFCVGDGVCVA